MAARIMVPLDGSRLSETAIPYACDLALHAGGVIRLVRVHSAVDPEFGDAHYMTCIELERERRQAEEEYLAQFTNDLEFGSFIEATHVLGGAPAQSLNDYINNEDIDVVVMATHGRAGLSRAMYGSVADELVRRSRVPVILLRPDDEGFGNPLRHQFRHVAIPVDGTRSSELMVDIAISLLGTTPRYTLLEIVPPAMPVGLADTAPMPVAFNQDEMVKTATNTLQRFAESLRHRGLNVDYLVMEQPDVAGAVCDYAVREHVDVIAMVTAGRGGWRRWLLGSVGTALIHKSPVPVMLLKNGYAHVTPLIA